MNADRYYDTPHRDNHARDAATASMQADVATTTRDIIADTLQTLATLIKGGHKLDLPHRTECLIEEVVDGNARTLDALTELPGHHGFSRTPIDDHVTAATNDYLTAVLAAARAYDLAIDAAFEHVTDTAEWEPDTTSTAWAPLFRRTA